MESCLGEQGGPDTGEEWGCFSVQAGQPTSVHEDRRDGWRGWYGSRFPSSATMFENQFIEFTVNVL